MLNMSATFDTVDHIMLLTCLGRRLIIKVLSFSCLNHTSLRLENAVRVLGYGISLFSIGPQITDLNGTLRKPNLL